MLPEFRPSRWLANRHLQTFLPTLLRWRQQLQPTWETLELEDGDFIELAWYPQQPQQPAKLALLFHGLEGSVQSPYAQGMLKSMAAKGWHCCVVHFRGCGRSPNRRYAGYHSGLYQDAAAALELLADRYPGVPMVGIGYSLGGNMLVNYLGRHAKPRLSAACVVSAPLDLAACADAINSGFSRFYQWYLLKDMRRKLRAKLARFTQTDIEAAHVAELGNFWQFDNRYTAPSHGYADAADYYRQASGLQYLQHIQTPTLVVHAADDPFMDQRVIPAPSQLTAAIHYQLLACGGHVGFIHGPLWRPRFWLEQALPEWLEQQLIVHAVTR